MVAQILNSNSTKTTKIKQLLELGFTRKQVAEMLNIGYGFVQNVFAATYPNQVNTRNSNFTPTIFNRKFGVEIEAYNVDKQDLKNELTRLGIEVRIEGYNHTTRGYWKIVNDGSITGANGFEVVSPVLEGADGLEQLNKVCQALKNCNAYINKSCGIHIHFDAIDFKTKQFKNLLLNYADLENVIDSFLPTSRRENNNRYCKSIIENKTKIENANTIREITQAIPCRYKKVNTQSYSRQNTIEFRHHSGSIEFEKISNWILFLHNLVEYSDKKRVQNVNFETLKTFNQTEIYTYLNNRRLQLAA